MDKYYYITYLLGFVSMVCGWTILANEVNLWIYLGITFGTIGMITWMISSWIILTELRCNKFKSKEVRNEL